VDQPNQDAIDVRREVASRPSSSTTPAASRSGPWRRMWLWGVAHAVDDLYQGLVPASVPYFVLDRHYSYLAASGLTLAAAFGSALPQPLVGLVVDRYGAERLPAIGVALAGVGLGLAGVVGPYPLVWTLVLLSGFGVALFHPAAGKLARRAAGESAAAMSVFAAGGNVGFFLAPVLATPALVALGVSALVWFVPPALLVAYVLLRHAGRQRLTARQVSAAAGADLWPPFLLLTGVEVLRSVTFFGVNTFVELYWIRHLHAARGLAGIALACFLSGCVCGTILGGRIADRIGAVRTVRLGGALTVPMLIALRLTPGTWPPLLFAVLTGLTLNMPFAVLVKLGQDYLPHRPGTASGVTLGLAVSVGGLVAPLWGLIAERHGPQGVLTVLCALPPLAALLSQLLVEPARARRRFDARRAAATGTSPDLDGPDASRGPDTTRSGRSR
jgi:FSR family fosmidomycin resistance protein-like MFS transporter